MEFTLDEIFSSNILKEYCVPRFMQQLWDEHQGKHHNHSHLLWTMLNIALWEKMFLSAPRKLEVTFKQEGAKPC